MRELESQIESWRRGMRAARVRGAVLEELEGHLGEEIERQMRAGVGAQQAFEGAVERLGPAPVLRNEFRKIRFHKIMKPNISRRLTEFLVALAIIAIQVSILLPLVEKVKANATPSVLDITLVSGWMVAFACAIVYYANLKRRKA